MFSWTQSRCILRLVRRRRGDRRVPGRRRVHGHLQEMYDEWPFFRTTLDNAALSLSRTELEIAEQYADLAEPDLRERFFPRVTDEYERATELITEIGQREDLHTRDWLGENLARRNPYVDPLNMLQVYLLQQTHRTDIEERTLRLTVKGIAAGMKNTG
ncbi:phosphoenolpyruvate carboxylase [Haloterrigena gelatinilytica]|uniref:phosphoenolpyruvate carboxylase n=1 Tax=Haloterrigena gelatinilytica TaxID=2741724 RepID=UPI0028112778|nr:phosphoenolpyruvate carboxylase [Haloterrigena gelatinilytica]